MKTNSSFTILGENISLIRPSFRNPLVFKRDQPRTPSCWSPPKLIKEHTGKVIGPCLKTKDGTIYLLFKGCHLNVLETFKLNPEEIVNSGFFLDNYNFVWR